MRLNKKNYLYLCIFLNLLSKYINFIQLKKNSINELYVLINKEHLFKLMSFFKKNTLFQFKTLSDICVVDNLLNKNNNISNSRFQIIYNLLSIKHSFRLFCSSCIGELNSNIKSLNLLFKSSN